MTFREARIEDLPEIVSIYNSIIPGRKVTADTEPVTVESRKEWFYAHHQQRPLLVGLESEKIIGFLSFKSFYGRPAYHITAEIGIYLHESARGKGLGNLFLKKSIELSPLLGIKNLLGFIFDSNELSIRLFEKHGFERWGFLPRVAVIEDVYYNLVIMGKNIETI